MKRVIIILIIATMTILASCTTDNTDTSGNIIASDVNNQDNKQKVTINSGDGEQVIEYNSKNSNDWCEEGSYWKSSGSQGNTQMKIVGIVNSGKYEGYCHVRYDFDTQGSQGNMDYYFDEKGNGYQVTTVNGETFETQWSQG